MSNQVKKFKYNCVHHKNRITDDFLLTMPNIEILDLQCEKCDNYCSKFKITDISISKLVHMIELDCSNCPEVSDLSINLLINLKKLVSNNCQLITNDVKYRVHDYKNIKKLFPDDIMAIILSYTGDCKIINLVYVYYPNLLKQIKLLKNKNCTSFVCRIHNKNPSKLLHEYVNKRMNYVGNIIKRLENGEKICINGKKFVLVDGKLISDKNEIITLDFEFKNTCDTCDMFSYERDCIPWNSQRGDQDHYQELLCTEYFFIVKNNIGDAPI